jgi:hypothetical protein
VDDLEISKSFVQITIDENEMQRRIQSFIDLKRAEINQNNLRDFIETTQDDESCARVASNVYRIEDSKGHLRIKRSKNETGPSDHRNIFNVSDVAKSDGNFNSINERLGNIENFLKLEGSPIPKDIYQRLKIIEDQITYLKTISPEYANFMTRKDSVPKKKISYTVDDLNKIILAMETRKS